MIRLYILGNNRAGYGNNSFIQVSNRYRTDHILNMGQFDGKSTKILSRGLNWIDRWKARLRKPLGVERDKNRWKSRCELVSVGMTSSLGKEELSAMLMLSDRVIHTVVKFE